MNSGNYISVVIPTLNEEAGIEETIKSLPLTKLSSQGIQSEILVVDGESTDKSAEVASQLGAKVVVESRKGYGRAYKTGFAHAKGDIIVTLDADGTYPSEMIPELILRLKKNKLDFITVNRMSKLEDGAMSKTHLFGNFILSTFLKILYSVKIKDSQSGMWIFRSDLLNKIELFSDDMAFSEELKIVAFAFFNSTEVEGRYSKRIGEAKLATFNHGWRNLRFLWDYRSKRKLALIKETTPPSIKAEISRVVL
jgi:glycosyltransferase involved in cell wall biosynthesis